jgi:xanthine dehydrogenase small subunit
MNDFFENKHMNRYFPGLSEYSELIASSQIRNMATPGGNIVNASPIGDMSVLLLALNADLILESEEGSERQLKLRDLFLDYKKLDLKPSELIKYITIEIPAQSVLFNFEKVSKRTHLDIASVNSSVCICSDGKIINEIYISAGGVAPYPKLLVKTSDFLKGKELSIDHLNTALDIIQEEISPISDIRGSAEYKRTLLRQLFLMHFVKLFPQNFSQKKILSLMLTNAVI